jgi:hypothetical protein
MIETKIFQTNKLRELQDSINHYIEQLVTRGARSTIIDIKYSMAGENVYGYNYSAMIIYEKGN